MIVYEDFIVKVPSNSAFLVGDLVETIMNVSFRQGFLLGKGIVVSVDTDPTSLSLFMVVGLQTQVRSPLLLGSLRKNGRMTSKL
jgi:hypothetical protein